MKKLNALIFVGTRPEAIKLIPLILQFVKNKNFITSVCMTGQHTEMVQTVFDLFDVNVSYFIQSKEKSTSDLADNLSYYVKSCGNIVNKVKPDVVIVHGDTTTTISGSLAAFAHGVKIAHIEAGLRTFNLRSPWPEEGFRQMVSRIADFNFAPTPLSRKNLRQEGVPKERIVVTGNTVVDSLMLANSKLTDENLTLEPKLRHSLIDDTRKVLLVTAHRRENWGEGIQNLCDALHDIAKNDIEIIFPCHLNPIVRDKVLKNLGDTPNVSVIPPQPYLDFIYLMKHASVILTDSGGIQEEAPTFNTKVLIMRDTTERPEAVDAGAAVLVGTNPTEIVKHTLQYLNNVESCSVNMKNPFGDGHASERIIEVLSEKL